MFNLGPNVIITDGTQLPAKSVIGEGVRVSVEKSQGTTIFHIAQPHFKTRTHYFYPMFVKRSVPRKMIQAPFHPTTLILRVLMRILTILISGNFRRFF